MCRPLWKKSGVFRLSECQSVNEVKVYETALYFMSENEEEAKVKRKRQKQGGCWVGW